MERQAVRQHYLHTWLALDVAAACPLDLLFAGKRLDIWRLPRLLKVMRVLKYKSLAHAGKCSGTLSSDSPSLSHTRTQTASLS